MSATAALDVMIRVKARWHGTGSWFDSGYDARVNHETAPRAVDPSALSGCDRCTVEIAHMDCAACALVLEQALASEPGVHRAEFHFATQRGTVHFDPQRTSVELILARLERLGYPAWLTGSVSEAGLVRRQRRMQVWRFGLALLLAMQVMMLTLPRYLGGEEVERELVVLLDGAALVLTLPVILWCAAPFYRGALRELRLRRPGMDAAISLGLLLAFLATLMQMATGSAGLYLDSISMTVALLLGVRWLDWEARQANLEALRQAQHALPLPMLELWGDAVAEEPVRVSADRLQPGDRVLLRPGQAVPIDVRIEEGIGWFDESVLTGESVAVERLPGGVVPAGALLLDWRVDPAHASMRAPALVARVERAWLESAEQVLGQVSNRSLRPEQVSLVTQVASFFMPVLILLALATGLGWALAADWATAVERTVAVLVVTCPCALAMAAPAAQARALTAALQSGVLIRRHDALRRLTEVTDFVFDKTGTLTLPTRPVLQMMNPEFDPSQTAALILALERAAQHPLADALSGLAPVLGPPELEQVSWQAGRGVSGIWLADGTRRRCRFGRRSFACPGAEDDARLWLAIDDRLVAFVVFEDVEIEGREPILQALRQTGRLHLVSGDHPERVSALAQAIAADGFQAQASAEDKAAYIQHLQLAGSRVAMIGDGSNDAPALACADVSIVVGGATDIARASGDFWFIHERLSPLPRLLRLARRSERIVRENLLWALGYNLLMIPLAVSGWITPVWAAVGMAASSALVVINARRVSGAAS